MSLLGLSSVTKSYMRGHVPVEVLRDATLTVEPASLVSVYGARASGKTTLLRIAAGFEAPDSGEVTRPAGTAWVQTGGPHVRQIAIEGYVALPLLREHGPRAAHSRARRALAALGAEPYAAERWDDLPDVARAVCAIAHATARRPRLLIADDPTAGLGLIDRERICRALRSLADDDGVGILMAVPDLPATLRSHATHALSRGRLLSGADRPDAGGGGAEVVALPVRRSA